MSITHSTQGKLILNYLYLTTNLYNKRDGGCYYNVCRTLIKALYLVYIYLTPCT